MVYRKVDWEKVRKILKRELTNGTPFIEACTIAGVDDETVRRRMKSHKKFAEAIERYKYGFNKKIRSRILQLLAGLERVLPLLNKQAEGVKLDRHQLKLLELYMKHLRWVAKYKLYNEFRAAQEVDVTSGGEPLKKYLVEVVVPKTKKKLSNKEDANSKNKDNPATNQND